MLDVQAFARFLFKPNVIIDSSLPGPQARIGPRAQA
jgi:hypothetical protein